MTGARVAADVHADTLVWRMLGEAEVVPRPLAAGLDRFWHAALGELRARACSRWALMARAGRIAEAAGRLAHLADGALREQAAGLRGVFTRGREARADIDAAFALVCAAATRTLGLEPHTVQIAAALVIESGRLAELATGEGKTLTATLPGTLAGWRRRGCHIVTVNDYLAGRDADTMRPLYELCGVSVTAIREDMDRAARRLAYRADVTYATHKELAADYVRDALLLGRRRDLPAMLARRVAGAPGAVGPAQLVTRGLACAIVDEADSILIDDAITPLLVGVPGPSGEAGEIYIRARRLADALTPPAHYHVDRPGGQVRLKAAGRRLIEETCGSAPHEWPTPRYSLRLAYQALFAKEFMRRNEQYVVRDDKIVIVDESTGRLMPDRTWRDGLHQAVEAKEDLPLTIPTATHGRLTFDRFFRSYRRLGGMTGTAWEARGELWHLYGLGTVRIPPHRPCVRVHRPARIFAGDDAKWRAVLAEIRRTNATGRPVLIGTRSVEASERLSTMLSDAGLAHEVLNALQHTREAEIVAQAGRLRRITVATNMAGRGTDIPLGAGVAGLGGLHVIATEHHQSRRVDRQLYGRAGRQGDPGSAIVLASTDDDLFRRFASSWMVRLLARVGSRAVGQALARGLVRLVQRRAEAQGRRDRRTTVGAAARGGRGLAFAGRE